MANERYNVEIGLQFLPGQASAQVVGEIQRILREAEAASRSGGGILDLKVADQFGERLGASIRRAVNQDIKGSPLYEMLRAKDKTALNQLNLPAPTSAFLSSQMRLLLADQARDMVAARAALKPGGSGGRDVTLPDGSKYGAKPYADVASRDQAVRSAELRYVNAVDSAAKARERLVSSIQKEAERELIASRKTEEARARETLAINDRTRREAERQRGLSEARTAQSFPVTYPNAALNPNSRLGAAQEAYNISERRLAIANDRLAEVRLSESANAKQELGAQNALDAATRSLTAARLRVAQEETRANYRPGLGQQFALGFKGASERPFAEQIGQAFKFSVFYGTAYKILFGLTQTFQATLQEGIAFQQQVTELKLATGRTREQAEEMANQFGEYSSQFGYGPSLGAQVGARAQGYYGTTESDAETQRRVGDISARIVSQLAFSSGGQPQDIQANLAAVGQAYGLGSQSQQYIGDLDAYFSRKFGIQAGATIDAVAQSGTVGRAAGFSPAEVSAIAADIQARTGATSAATGGYLAQIFSRAGEGSLTKLSQRYGIDSTADFATQFKALAGIYKERPEERDDISAAFGRGKVQNAVISLLQDFDRVQKAASDSDTEASGSLSKAVDLKIGDIGGQIQQTVGELRDFANALGQTGLLDTLGVLAVTFRETLGGVTEVLKVFNELPRPVRDVITALGLLAVAGKLAATNTGAGSIRQLLFASPVVTPGAAPAVSAALSAEAAAANATATALAAEAAAARAAATATGGALAIAQANVAALGSMVATAEAGLTASTLRLYGPEGSRDAARSSMEAKRAAGTERIVAAETEASLASQRHTAALISEAEATTAATGAAVREAEAQAALAVAQSEAAATAAAGATTTKGGLLRGGGLATLGLTAAAIVGFLAFNKARDTSREQSRAASDYYDFQTSVGEGDLNTADGQRARAASAKEIARQSADAADGYFDRLHNIGNRIGGGESAADEARARAKQAEADQALAEANAKLIEKFTQDTSPTQALITGFDEDSLKSSLDTISRSGGTAKEQFDALALSVRNSGEAAARAAANYDPNVLAAQNAGELYSQLSKSPGFDVRRGPNGAGEDLNNWVKGATFGLSDGPIGTENLTNEIFTKALNQGDLQKRLAKALDSIGSLADLDSGTIGSLASDIVGSIPQDIIDSSGGALDQGDYDSIQSELEGQVSSFLKDLKSKSVATGELVRLTNNELTLLADNVLEVGKQALADLPETSYTDRISQARAIVRTIQQYIRHTAGGASNPQAQKDLAEAQSALATEQFNRMEALRKAAQSQADSTREAQRIGRRFLRRELRAAIGANDGDLLAQILSQAGRGAIETARQMILDAAAVARVAAEFEAKTRALASNMAGDLTKPGSVSTANPYDDLLAGLNAITPAEGSADVYGGTGVGPSETAADRAVAAAQANAARKQGAIAGARAEIYAASVAMDQAKKGSVEYYNALGQYYQARQSLTDAIIAYRQNLYLLGHDLTNPLTQARAAVQAAAAQLRADRSSGAGADQLASDRVSLQQAQADAEATAFSQRLEAVQTADDLGRISHQKYLSYLKHEHERLSAVKNRTFQQQQQLDQIDQLMKEAAESMSGQWNFGDIKLPTPYEVQRRVQEVYGTAVNGGKNNGIIARDPLTQDLRPDYDKGATVTNTVFITGTDTAAVRKVLKELIGDHATTSTTAPRHR